MSNLRPAKVFSSKIEFGQFKPEPEPEPLPDDYSEVLRGSCVLACEMVPVGPDGDEYNEDLGRERQRISNGILKMKGYLHIEPAASAQEIIALMHTPHYQQWLRNAKNPAAFDLSEEEYLREEEEELEWDRAESERMWQLHARSLFR